MKGDERSNIEHQKPDVGEAAGRSARGVRMLRRDAKCVGAVVGEDGLDDCIACVGRRDR